MTEQQIVDSLKTATRNPLIVDEAMRAVYLNYYGMVRGLALKSGLNEADANDIFQDVAIAFVLAIKHGSYEYSPSTGLGSYLYRIARNKIFKMLRQERRSIEREYIYDQSLEPIDEINWTGDPTFDSFDHLDEAFNSLGETCKSILRAFYYDKVPLKEIAQKFDLGTEDAVKNRKYRCILKLREALEKWKDR